MPAQNQVGQHRNRVGVVTLRDIWREAGGIRIIIMLTVHRALSKVSCCNRCNMLMAVGRDAGSVRRRRRNGMTARIGIKLFGRDNKQRTSQQRDENQCRHIDGTSRTEHAIAGVHSHLMPMSPMDAFLIRTRVQGKTQIVGMS